MLILIPWFAGAFLFAYLVLAVRWAILRFKGTAAGFFIGASAVGLVISLLVLSIVLHLIPPGPWLHCISNVRQIGLACVLYAQDWDGYTPPNLGAATDYVMDGLDTYFCPADPMGGLVETEDKDSLFANIDHYSSYEICGQVKLEEVANKSKFPMVWARRPYHETKRLHINVCFLDEHCEYLPVTELVELLRASGASKQPWEGLVAEDAERTPAPGRGEEWRL